MRVDKNRENSGEKRRKIFLTGIGMGMPEMLTARALPDRCKADAGMCTADSSW